MREIKFRAWDIIDKRMISWRELLDYGSGLADYLEHPNELVFQQFTGLLDKNGEEIYEGDIVRWDNGIAKDEYRGSIWQIIWDNDYAQFTLKLIKGLFTDTPYFKRHWRHYLEIIGNIYSNPELLNSKGGEG
jgi:uncharacterized phage protein (TIGR01671 family)